MHPDGLDRIGVTVRGQRPQPAGVVLQDQRLRISSDNPGDAADMATGVKIAAARRVVVVLDPGDDRFPDPGLLADLGNGETGLTSRLGEGFSDAHTAPPLRYAVRRRVAAHC